MVVETGDGERAHIRLLASYVLKGPVLQVNLILWTDSWDKWGFSSLLQLEHVLRRHIEVSHDESCLVMDHLVKARGNPWRLHREILADLVDGGFEATHVEQIQDSTESLLSESVTLYTTIAQAVMVARPSNDPVLLLARMMPLPPLLWVITTAPLEMPHRIPAISWISHPSDLTTVLDALVGIKEVRVSWEP
jgi:hypothetical protein